VDEIIGVSAWSEHVRSAICQVARYCCNVLVVGPSGTGKELIARAIHKHSPRAAGPLVPVDCTAIPPALFASQLFGHVKGAFSGAACDTLGCFRAADGGTIFLDEIGELSMDLQAQLLRVVQQRAVLPVGSYREIPIDVRIIAATNRRLADDVEAGRFRLDLYYRLNVVRFQTVPLDERPEDIEPLSRHFLAKLAVDHGLPQKRLSAAALNRLAATPWPGNVRQLQNVLERAVVFTQGEEITEQFLFDLVEAERPTIRAAGDRLETARPLIDRRSEQEPPTGLSAKVNGDGGAWPTLAEWERRLLAETLQRTGHNQRAAARLLEIDRRVLARKIRDHGIPMPATSRVHRG
jgi:DNA-binding NtrC family response regulator